MPKKIKNKRSNEYESKESFLPVSVSKMTRATVPSISTSGGNIRIRHREMLIDLRNSPQLNVHYFEVNPGLPTTFPWLAPIAGRFESYTLNRLSFEYVPFCSSATNGCVIMSPDYDVSDYPPEDVVAISSFPNSVRTPAWQCARMVCDPKLLVKLVAERMVRSDNISDVDLKLYDTLVFYLATYGGENQNTIGSVWIEYDITLRTPNMDTSVDESGSARCTAVVGTTPALPLGTAPQVLNGSVYSPVMETVSSDTIRIKRPGDYCLQCTTAGTGITVDPVEAVIDAAVGAVKNSQPTLVNGAGTSGSADLFISMLRPGLVKLAINAATLSAFGIRASPYSAKII